MYVFQQLVLSKRGMNKVPDDDSYEDQVPDDDSYEDQELDNTGSIHVHLRGQSGPGLHEAEA